ncbi:MAG: hypothetical protein ACE5EG_10695 [Thermoanaerobaculia bacterium]
MIRGARNLVTLLALLLAAAPVAAGEVGVADVRSAEIAETVMERMGGHEAWEATRFLTWNFFGKRRHLWDKHSGDIRVEGTDRDSGDAYLVLMNLNSEAGRAWVNGEEVTEPEALAALLDRGEAAWINDSYWVFMPYKLRDPGVTLKHVGEGMMVDGRAAEVLELTFAEVGRTPENKYRVYVAADSGLVEQWDFYRQASDEEPRFQIPWHDWRPHGDILLSADRGEGSHTGIAVLDEVPAGAFTSPEPVAWDALVPPAEASGE